MRRSDLIIGSLAVLLGLATLVITPWAVPNAEFGAIADMRSPAFFPLLAGVLLAGFGLLLIITTLPRPAAPLPAITAPRRLVAVAAVLLGYGLAMPWLGMFLSSGVAVVLLALILGERRWWRVGLLAVLVPLVVYILFERQLLILFPRGVAF